MSPLNQACDLSFEPGFQRNGFQRTGFKELASKELGVLGYSDLLGMGVLGYSDLLGLGVLGYYDLLGVGVPMSGKVSAMCRPAAAHCTSIFFPMDWASMIRKVGAMCRPPAAHPTSLFFPMDWASMIGRHVSLVSFLFLAFLLGGTGRPFEL